MLGNYNNKVFSSFLLWLDNFVSNKAQAYTNYSGQFFPVTGKYGNYYTYGLPVKQLVYDTSVNGANVMTGLYLNNVFVTTGISGFMGVDYSQGTALFNSNVSNYKISGNYATKYFNIVLTADNDETIVFKNKYYLKSKFSQSPTGLGPDAIPYPLIFIKDDGQYNDPFAFGGQEQTFNNIRCVIMTDTLFSLHAIQGALNNSIRSPIALFESNEMPFNALGGLISGSYNYTGIAYKKINEQNFMFIEDVRAPRQVQRVLTQVYNGIPDREIYFNFIDFELSKVRQPRNE